MLHKLSYRSLTKLMLSSMLCITPLQTTESNPYTHHDDCINAPSTKPLCNKLNKQSQVSVNVIKGLNLKKENFLSALKRGGPWWIDAQIQNDLAPFTAGISKQMLDALWNKYDKEFYRLVRFTVKKRKISYQTYKDCPPDIFESYFRALHILNWFVGLPDVDFIISLHDVIPLEESLLFGYGKNDSPGQGKGILIPDFIALKGHANLDLSVEKGVRKFPWGNRLQKAFWRGSTTGGVYSDDNWDQFPRTQLALHSLESPDLLDAKITTVCQLAPGSRVQEILFEYGLMGNSIPIEEHLQYRYLIDVDGNGMTVPRSYWILLSDSLLIKQQSDWVLWYSRGLIPYVNYVLFTTASDDLDGVIEWAREHDNEARKIALEGRRFAKEDLSTENTYLYLYKVLVAYSALQK